MFPLGGGRIIHLIVLYGYQGADRDPERLALTDQLLDAALGELGVVAREQPCLLVADINVEPTKVPCLSEGIMAGLWVDLEASWASASGGVPGFTCRQDWESTFLSRRDFMVGCPRAAAAAAVSGCGVLQDRWVVPHFAVRACFDYSRWFAKVTLPVHLCGRHLGCRYLIRVGSPRLLKFRGFEMYMMIGLQLMSRDDALDLDSALDHGDVSRAWVVWSSAVEAALADAYRFAGGPVPDRGLVFG